MQYCKECGLLVPQGADRCPQCGAVIPPEPVRTAPQDAPAQAGAPLYEAPAPMPAAKGTNPEGDDLTLTGFVLSMILMEIPLIGGIMQLVWTFGGTQNPTRRKLATATLIKAGINLIFGLLLLVLVAVFGLAAYNSIGSTPPQYYAW